MYRTTPEQAQTLANKKFVSLLERPQWHTFAPMRYIRVSVWLCAALAALYAQSRSGWGGAGWFSLGYGTLSGHDKLRSVAEANGLSVAKSPASVLVGGGGGGYLGRVFVGGTGEALVGKDLSGGLGLFQLGYFWRFGEKLVLLPMVGVGGAGYTFALKGRPNDLPFTDAVSPSGGIPPRSLSASGTIGGLTLALQYFTMKGTVLGIEAGYDRALSKFSSWSTAGIDLKNGPEITPQRFYVRISVGGGGLSRKEE